MHGADLAQSLLREGLLDELEIHLIPMVLARRDAPALSGGARVGRRLSLTPPWPLTACRVRARRLKGVGVLARGLPLISLGAALLIAGILYRTWVRAGRPGGIQDLAA